MSNDPNAASQISPEDAQEGIRNKLQAEQFKERVKQFFQKLYAEAVIETKYELPVAK